jgi:hypothetical protein
MRAGKDQKHEPGNKMFRTIRFLERDTVSG